MAQSRGGRTRSEASRQAIFGATRTLLAEQGYDGLTIERVAAHAGVGKQTIYRWWHSKSALVAECIADGGPALSLEVPVPDTGDLLADLESWLAIMARYAAEPQAAALLRGLISATAESPLVAERMYSQVTLGAELALSRRISGGHEVSHRHRSATTAVLGAFIYSILINQPMDADTVHDIAALIARGIDGTEE